MLTSKPRQLHVRKVPCYGDLPPDSWGSGMPRCLSTTLMTWSCLKYGSDVQIGWHFTVPPLFLPAFGRNVKALLRLLVPPVLTVSWLEVSVFVLGARVLIRKLVLTQLQSVAHVASQMLEYVCAVLKQQMYRQKYPLKNTFNSGRIFHQFFPCERFSWHWRNCLGGEWSVTGILEVMELKR